MSDPIEYLRKRVKLGYAITPNEVLPLLQAYDNLKGMFKMQRYAVSYVSFADNELSTEIVEAEDKVEALTKHSKIANVTEQREYFDSFINLEDAKAGAFESDCLVDVIEVPNE